MAAIERIQSEILPLQEALYGHSIYGKLTGLGALKHFMGFHVFAVWDFMNLLTALQQVLTSTSVPWKPSETPALARFVNQIKLEEESDVIDGEVISHFQYYVKSMDALGVDTGRINDFQRLIAVTDDYEELVTSSCVPEEAVPFLMTTYESIQSGVVETAAGFTFGRETIISKMFLEILSRVTIDDDDVLAFKRYLERHIELDGNEHGELSLQLISMLCGSSESAWERAAVSAKAAILARIEFYDQIELGIGSALKAL